MTSQRIYPTGQCFDDVLDHQAILMKEAANLAARQYICHGICLAPEGPHEGEPFAHAWVEDPDDQQTYQSGLMVQDDGRIVKVWYGLRTDDFYAFLRVQERTRYTLLEALWKNWTTNHYGPWVEKYRLLCGGNRIFQSEV